MSTESSLPAKRWDAIVVGAGATGGWAARALTQAGLEVLQLEAGPELDTKSEFQTIVMKLLPELQRGRDVFSNVAAADAPEAVPGGAAAEGAPDRDRQWVQPLCYAYNDATRHLFVDDVDHPYSTDAGKPFAWIRMRLVGGRTALWNRVALRLSDRQLKAASVDGFGDDWPLAYEDLRPYYDEVERFIGVYGEVEGHPEVPDGIFLPPPPMSAAERDYRDRLAAAFPARRALRLRQVGMVQPGVGLMDPAAVPYFCSAASTIPEAKASGRLTLQSDAIVSHVLCDRRDHAAGVAWIDAHSHEKHEALGKVVLLCASTLESTRILLNSRGAEHPQGLGNSSGTLGCYLADHLHGISVIASKPRESQARDPGNHGLYVPSWRAAEGGSADYLRGFGVQVRISRTPDEVRFTAIAFGEMLSRRDNRVSLDPELVDKWGIPALRVEAAHGDNELAMARAEVAEVVRLAEAGGFAVKTSKDWLYPPGLSSHECGTARMGKSPGDSVLNAYNQAWDVPNVFVTDGAAFTSVGYQNPTLTMMALTARACAYVAERVKDGRFA